MTANFCKQTALTERPNFSPTYWPLQTQVAPLVTSPGSEVWDGGVSPQERERRSDWGGGGVTDWGHWGPVHSWQMET